jgi:hypothetical protein
VWLEQKLRHHPAVDLGKLHVGRQRLADALHGPRLCAVLDLGLREVRAPALRLRHGELRLPLAAIALDEHLLRSLPG